MYIRPYVVTLCLALSTFSSPIKRDATTVDNDITDINTQTNALDTSILAFPNSGGTIIQAFAIHTAAVNLEGVINNATTDASATAPLTVAEGNVTLGLVQTLVPNIQKTLSDLVSKKVPLENLPVSGVTSIVLQDLVTLKSDSDAYIKALLAITPAPLLAQAQTQANLVDQAFSQAIAVYNSSSS